MMDKELMKKALMAKKGKGIDLTIILGSPVPEEKSEELAPGAPEEEVQDELMEGQMPDEALLGGMSEYDKASLMDREPKGLGDRAKKAMLMKMGK